jgi:hypothetical protein
MKLLLILVSISFGIGLALGFYLYIYLYLPQFLETFTNVIPFASISTMVGVIVKLVSEWYKKLHLEFGEIFKENNIYFLQVLKVRGEQAAEDCEGHLTTKNIDNCISVWRFDSERVRTINVREDLRLFELKNDKIIFPAASSDEIYKKTLNRFGENEVKLIDYINEKLTVIIGSRNGYKLETTLSITDILSLKNLNNKKFVNKLKDCFRKK